jgi:hypothetical protein
MNNDLENLLKAVVEAGLMKSMTYFSQYRWFSGEGLNVGGTEYGARSYWLHCDVRYFIKLKSCYL